MFFHHYSQTCSILEHNLKPCSDWDRFVKYYTIIYITIRYMGTSSDGWQSLPFQICISQGKHQILGTLHILRDTFRMILSWRAHIVEIWEINLVSSAFPHHFGFRNRCPSGGLYIYDDSRTMVIYYESANIFFHRIHSIVIHSSALTYILSSFLKDKYHQPIHWI